MTSVTQDFYFYYLLFSSFLNVYKENVTVKARRMKVLEVKC